MICGLLIIFPYLAVSHVFQGPGSLGSRFFRVWVQDPGPGSRVRVQGLGPGTGSRVEGPGSESRSRVRVQGPGSGSRVRVQVLEVALL